MTLTNTNARVHILSKICAEGDALTSELDTDAVFYATDGTFVCQYYNADQGCETRVTVDAVSVRVTHTGGVQASMLFKDGYVDVSDYGVTYGTLSMEIHTERILVDIDETGGSIALWYTILLGGQASTAKMNIEIIKEMC